MGGQTVFARWRNGFLVTAVLLCIGYRVLSVHNGRDQMADFRVYYDAASALRTGDQVYGLAFGVSSGFYKYAPVAAALFIPFTWLDYAVAAHLYYALVTLAILMAVVLFAAEMRRETGEQKAWWLFLFPVVFLADHLERELHLGNVNVFLLLLAYAVFCSIRSGREWLAGLLFAVIVVFKPHFLVLAPWIVWKQQWRAIFSFCISLPVLLAMPALLTGWSQNLSLHNQWIAAMRDHNVHLSESPNTVYGILHHWLLKPMHLTVTDWFVPAVFAGVALALLVYVLFLDARQPRWKAVPYMEFFLPLALVPNIVHTDTEHFMWTLPLLFIIAALMREAWQGKWGSWIFLVVAFIPYTLNSPDIVGKRGAHMFDEEGGLGAANLVIVLVAVWVHNRYHQRRMAPDLPAI